MGTLWCMVGYLMALMAIVQMAAVPSTTDEDTLIVTRDKSTPTSTSEVTTEEPNAPVELKEMQVTSEVTMRYAHTAVVTHVRNPAKKAQETTFRVLLPETAFISGFTMILDGKPYKAYVKGKNEAKEIYKEAVSQGFGAAHVGAKARDSNHFTVSVNVEPNTVAVFNLTYEELLVRRNGVYNHAINLHPGTLVPKLNVKVHIKETEKIKTLRVPEVRSGNEIDATPEDAQNTKATIERTHDDREAIVTFSPDLDEQKRLMDVYLAKTKEAKNQQHSYSYYNNNDNNDDKEGVLGQFVVQYDVDRPNNGEVLINDGYFVHVFAPSNLPPLNKHVVFVLDTSGSMSGHKIDQLREAMKVILSELNTGDYFSIVEFSNGVLVHDLKEAAQDIPKDRYHQSAAAYASESGDPELVQPYQATPENIAKAKVIIQRLEATGGTNIDKALEVAVKIVKKGIAKSNGTTETSISTTIKPTPEAGGNKLEPIIIFLTDGEPNIGESDPTRIINRVTEKNFGDSKSAIFSLAFGEDADRSFLRRLSLRNDGFMRHIYEASDAALQLRDFYKQVASPLLSHVKFTYPDNQVKEVTKSKYRMFYDGSEVVVAGQFLDASVSPPSFEPEVEAFCGGVVIDAPSGKKKFGAPKVTRVQNTENYPLERMWAYLTIKQLLDERDATGDQDDTKSGPGKKALDLALKYSFVTPLTSLVVVKPNATNAVNAESVDKENQNGPHQYISSSAFSQGLPGMASAYLPLAPSAPVGGAALSLNVAEGSYAYEAEDDIVDAGYVGRPAAFTPVQFRLSQQPDVSYLRPLTLSSFRGASGGSMFASVAQYDAMPYSSGYPGMQGLFGKTSFGSADRVYLSTPFTPYVPTTQLDVQDPLSKWKLESYQWVAPLLNATLEALQVQSANGPVILKLSSQDEAPKESIDADCTQAGEAGSCVYLTRCQLADDFTAENYEQRYCSVNGYAGVCCPKTKIDLKKTR